MSLKQDSSTHLRCPSTAQYSSALIGGIEDVSVGEGGVREANAGTLSRGERAQGEGAVAGASVRNIEPQLQAGEAADAGQGTSPRATVPIPGPGLFRASDPGFRAGLGGYAAPLVCAVEGSLALVDAVDQRALGAEPARARAASGYESSDDGQEARSLQEEAGTQDIWADQAGPMAPADYPHPDRVLECAGARLDGGGYGEPLRPLKRRGLRFHPQRGRAVFRMGGIHGDLGQAGGGGGGGRR